MEKDFLRILYPKWSTELTVGQFLIKYIVVGTQGFPERGHSWKSKF